MPTKISIVTPVFNEADGLKTYSAVIEKDLFSDSRFECEVVLVDDGSRDGSWAMIAALCARDRRYRGVRLARNFGSHTAINAGIHAATGDAVGVLACDLQDPVSAMQEMIAVWLKGDTDVVWGVRRSRPEGLIRKLMSALLIRVLRQGFPKDSKFVSGSFLLVDKKAANAYRAFTERQRNTFAIIAWSGFRQAEVFYDRVARGSGSSGWSVWRMINSSFDTILSYSDLPIKLISALGILLFAGGTGLGLYIVYSYVSGSPASGWTSITLIITSFFAVQFLILGVLGEYLRRIYIEVLNRPHYLIAEEISR